MSGVRPQTGHQNLKKLQNLKQDNKKLLDYLDLLNSELEIKVNQNKNIAKKTTDISKKEIKELNSAINKLAEEKQKIKTEYKIISNKNSNFIYSIRYYLMLNIYE